jgi:hypothetical protein
MAPRDIVPGADWTEAILSGIGACRLMIVVFSSGANESTHVRIEVMRAVSKGKTIIPFRIEDILPSRAMEYCLSNTQWFDALPPPPEQHLARLVESVTMIIENRQPSEVSGAPLATTGVSRDVRNQGYEFRSGFEIFGWPLVHIAMNLPTGEGRRSGACGIIAIGDSPQGVVAIGSFAKGVVAMGAFSMGLISFGFVAVGLLPAGVIALGILASWGLVSVAPVAVGFAAAGYYTYAVHGVGFVLLAHVESWVHKLIAGMCLLSYLLPQAARFWVRSVLVARSR